MRLCSGKKVVGIGGLKRTFFLSGLHSLPSHGGGGSWTEENKDVLTSEGGGGGGGGGGGVLLLSVEELERKAGKKPWGNQKWGWGGFSKICKDAMGSLESNRTSNQEGEKLEEKRLTYRLHRIARNKENGQRGIGVRQDTTRLLFQLGL